MPVLSVAEGVTFESIRMGHVARFKNVPFVSKRCTLDLPGFKNLEGLYIVCFSPNDSPQTLVHS